MQEDPLNYRRVGEVLRASLLCIHVSMTLPRGSATVYGLQATLPYGKVLLHKYLRGCTD